MKFDTGLIDRLFGKRVEMSVPQANGTAKTVMVTEAWLAQVEAQGKITRLPGDHVTVVIHGLDNERHGTFEIGNQISLKDRDLYLDPVTRCVYAVETFDDNWEPQLHLITKAGYDAFKAEMKARS